MNDYLPIDCLDLKLRVSFFVLLYAIRLVGWLIVTPLLTNELLKFLKMSHTMYF